MYKLFKKFLEDKISDFRRIVRKARGEVDLKDLESNAWIVAAELGEKRRAEIDFSNEDDRNWVLATLYNQAVRRGNSVRYAVSIDQALNIGDDELPTLAERLPAPETSDPLHALLDRERDELAAKSSDRVLASTFSQAAAYAISLDKFDDLKTLSIFLAISSSTLTVRISKAALSLRVQDSLFDGIERISKSFMPRRGIPVNIVERSTPVPGQLDLLLPELT